MLNKRDQNHFLKSAAISQSLRVCLSGAAGRMGQEVVRSSKHWSGIQLVCTHHKGESLEDLLQGQSVDVFVDLSTPESVFDHVVYALNKGIASIIGTTGIHPDKIQQIRTLSRQQDVSVMVVPNFSLGAALSIKVSEWLSEWISDVEIIEMHHDQKRDRPSGTALQAAAAIQKGRLQSLLNHKPHSQEVPIHSVRLKGILAQQSVLFGLPGETLELKHAVIERSAYMMGLELCIRKILVLKKDFRFGLESILWNV